MKLSEHLLQLPEICLERLIADDATERFRNLLPLLGETSPRQFLIECELYKPEKAGDFSIQYTRGGISSLLEVINGDMMRGVREQSLVWARVCETLSRWPDDALFSDIRDFWLEFDYAALGKDIPLPCCFFDANSVRSETAIKNAADGPLAAFLGFKPSEDFRKNLGRCVSALDGVGLFQLGVMLGREENPRPVRFFTNGLKAEQVVPFLSNVGWGTREDYTKIDAFLLWAGEYATGVHSIDFAMYENGFASKLGIEVYILPGTHTDNFLDAIVSHGYALQEKCDGIRAWLSYDKSEISAATLVNGFSHFKFPFDGDFLGAKTYLRQMRIQDIMQANQW